MRNILNLVYDKWENGKSIPNGKSYYDNPHCITDGSSVINQARMNVGKDELDIKEYPIEEVKNNPNKNFYYIINHHIATTFIFDHIHGENGDFYYERKGVEIITDELKEYLRKYDNLFLLLITEHEPVCEIEFVKIIKYFELNDIDTKKVFLINNNYKMEEYVSKYNFDVNIFKTNFLLTCKIKDMWKLGESEYVTNKQGKFFMTFNKSLKPHRVGLLCFLIKNKMIDDVNWSFVPNSNEMFDDFFIKSVSDENFTNEIQILKNVKFKLSDFESQIFSYDENDANQKNDLTQRLTEFENNETYLNSYVNITTESNFNYYENTVHISEKSYKPFYFYQLPIFIASKDHVKLMKEKYGFDMFDDIIDHSYDCEVDHKKRLEMVLNEIKRIYQNKEMIIDFYEKNYERLENNKKKTIDLLNVINKDYTFYMDLAKHKNII